ncbi:hypothetical protein JW977_04255 [Candidatus Falkowbacteria bacterium]|nr:hypothetical protein [Candidatus Falkowbacteria bacterium]
MEDIWMHGKGLIKKLPELNAVLAKMGIEIIRQSPAQAGQDDLVLIKCPKETLQALQLFTKAKLHG